MTASDNMAIGTNPGRARAGRAFRFFRVRGNAEFFPGAGTSIRFANRDVDMLTLPGLPAGLLTSTDSVKVTYNGERVFQGEVAKIVDTYGRGDTRVQKIVCHGPWGRMNRLVFRQTWGFKPANADTAINFSSSRVILNQTMTGVAQNLTAQIREICQFAAGKCGFSYAANNIDVDDIQLPFDESRDLTCASAIQRELRFFPKKIVRFDYSGTGNPAIKIAEPTTTDADYVADIPKSARSYEYTAHPVKCVDVYTAAVDTSLQEPALTHQYYPDDEDLLEDVDCLHAFIPLEPGSSSTTWKSFDNEVEGLPVSLQDKQFWLRRHPRLQGVAASNFSIVGTVRRNGSRGFSNIARGSSSQLAEAGIEFEVETFTAKCKIDTGDDIEEDVTLSMSFLMTNGTNRTYTWQTGSSSVAGETLPAGLAQAIFEQRSGSLLNEDMTIRLGDVLPVLGDACDGLYLQEYTVDCYGLTAELHFGQPEYLSVEDMRDLLGGFRQRGYASNAPARSGEEQDDQSAEEVGPIPPISTSAWSPGFKVKTTVKAKNAGDGGTIKIDSADVKGKEAKFRDVTMYDESGNPQHLTVLATPLVPGEAEPEEEEPADPHEQVDEHGTDDNDPCNPSGDAPGDGSGGGGGSGVQDDGGGVQADQGDTEGGAGVCAGKNPSDGESARGCQADNC